MVQWITRTSRTCFPNWRASSKSIFFRTPRVILSSSYCFVAPVFESIRRWGDCAALKEYINFRSPEALGHRMLCRCHLRWTQLDLRATPMEHGGLGGLAHWLPWSCQEAQALEEEFREHWHLEVGSATVFAPQDFPGSMVFSTGKIFCVLSRMVGRAG